MRLSEVLDARRIPTEEGRHDDKGRSAVPRGLAEDDGRATRQEWPGAARMMAPNQTAKRRPWASA